MRNIKRIFIHCTAGNQKQTKQQLLDEFKARGWKNPGYHYVVFPDGKIEQLLDEDGISNGVQGYNSTSINIAYVGGIDKQGRPVDNRTGAQKQQIYTLLQGLKERYPDAHIMGHRDIWGKDPSNWKKMCPCFDAELEYATLTPIVEEEPTPQVEEQTKPSQEPRPTQHSTTNRTTIIVAAIAAIIAYITNVLTTDRKMKIIYNNIIPFEGYKAINLFGFVFARNKFKPLDDITINHEAIHTAQMRELLYIFFYLIYGVEYLINLVNYTTPNAAYRNISFEKEAYEHEGDMDYLKNRKHYAYWK